jgi:D-galactose 1-dehydrogenase
MDGRTASDSLPIRLGLVGIGKIARDQHIPAIASMPDFTFVATASRHAMIDGVPGHHHIADLIAGGHDLAAISLCTPPLGRHAAARQAIDAGLHVMLEKPPGATVSEVTALADHAVSCGVTLFATWHSREAAAVDAARDWLMTRRIVSARIDWREDIRVWHSGQDWILAAGGFGVFDPGINALSIATAILPGTLCVDAATLHVPVNRAAPIAASIDMVLNADISVAVAFDFLQTGPQSWDIAVVTDDGTMTLHDGGRRLVIDGAVVSDGPDIEYPRLYRRFADLIARGQSDVDLRPLQLVADVFLVAKTVRAAAFDF